MAEMSEEQVKELQEKLKNMSPEELKQFQKQQCIFCHIIAGKVASKKIYDDEHCIAILDTNPANPGHILLIPKEHYAIMPMVPEDIIAHLAMVAKALSHVLLNSLKAEGTNILIANGVAAGQRAQHFMIHVIPRKENDGVELSIPSNKISEADISKIKKALDEKIATVMGKQEKPMEIKPKEEKSVKKKKSAKKSSKKTVKKKEPSKKSANLDDIAELFK